MTADQWIASFASRVAAEPPSAGQVDEILRLAALAAHASERTAAPIACWMAGRTGRSLEDLCRIAEETSRT